jgi:hypothetical protein
VGIFEPKAFNDIKGIFPKGAAVRADGGVIKSAF